MFTGFDDNSDFIFSAFFALQPDIFADDSVEEVVIKNNILSTKYVIALRSHLLPLRLQLILQILQVQLLPFFSFYFNEFLFFLVEQYRYVGYFKGQQIKFELHFVLSPVLNSLKRAAFIEELFTVAPSKLKLLRCFSTIAPLFYWV